MTVEYKTFMQKGYTEQDFINEIVHYAMLEDEEMPDDENLKCVKVTITVEELPDV